MYKREVIFFSMNLSVTAWSRLLFPYFFKGHVNQISLIVTWRAGLCFCCPKTWFFLVKSWNLLWIWSDPIQFLSTQWHTQVCFPSFTDTKLCIGILINPSDKTDEDELICTEQVNSKGFVWLEGILSSPLGTVCLGFRLFWGFCTTA